MLGQSRIEPVTLTIHPDHPYHQRLYLIVQALTVTLILIKILLSVHRREKSGSFLNEILLTGLPLWSERNDLVLLSNYPVQADQIRLHQNCWNKPENTLKYQKAK